MADRRRQIMMLLETRFDFMFAPETFTGKVVRRGASAGKSLPSHWQPCGSCDGGSRRDRFGRLVECERCGGKGRQRVDDYTGATVVTDEDRDVPMRELLRRDTSYVKCPDCQDLHGNAMGVVHGRACSRCRGTGEAAVPGSWLSPPVDSERAGGDPLDAMLDAIERRGVAGSYRELDLALAGVVHHANKPLRYFALTLNATQALRLLDEVFGPETTKRLDDLSLFESSLVELALAYIDERMPPIIRVPAGVAQNARERREHLRRARGRGSDPRALLERDRQIRRWALEGKPYPWICAQVGLGDRQLREIINGKGAAA